MNLGSSDVLSALYGKDLIAYGTGNAGKIIIPYLARNPNIKLHGVTNSRIKNNAGIFLETGLPLRSLKEWAERLPYAAILVTANRGYDEIYEACRAAGFQEVIFAPAELQRIALSAAEDIAEAQLLSNLSALCLANEIRDTHKASFSEFKGCNRGKSIAVVGCGPTLNYYSQIQGIPHVGVNASFLRENLKLDYYFLLHYIPEWCEKLKCYSFFKFFLVNRNDNIDDKFPEYIVEENDARRFFAATSMNKIQFNLEYYPLMGFSSVIFPAIQFALYTRPKRILLIGCDCSPAGHFDGRTLSLHINEVWIPLILEGYQKLKLFIARYYPDTEIISVNPVGLKGMFHDVYTESYLDAHPELDRIKCEILREFTFRDSQLDIVKTLENKKFSVQPFSKGWQDPGAAPHKW